MSKHDKKMSELLVGKTIKETRYLTSEEMEDMGWHSNPLAIIFDDGSFMVLQKDDEGNDGGAAFFVDEKKGIDTVIYTT